jgi:ribose transport system permease protein
MRKTRFGLRTLALGSNQAAAERAGLRVKSHILALTVIGGGMAGFVGFVDLSMYGQTAINGHGLDALAAITAAVIGGAALHGGRISVPGTLWGALLASILLNGLIVIGVQSFWQRVATGAVLILAVALDQLRTHRRQTS